MAKKSMADGREKFLNNLIITGGKFNSPGNIPTGYFKLDFIIHHGCDPTKIDLNALQGYDPSVPLGLPRGKVVEFFGEEGGGKSSIAYRVVGNAQRMGMNAAWIDAECSFSEALATINGCDIERILNINTSMNNLSAERVLDTILHLCECDKVPHNIGGKTVMVDAPKVIVVDSVASLVPNAVDESTSEQQHMGLLARLFSTNMGKVAAAVERNGVLLILINQLREKIGQVFGNPETSPGGRALKHHFSLRLKISRKKSAEARIFRQDEETDSEVLIGAYSYVRLEKNRFAKPYLESVEIPIYYEAYFPQIEEVAFDTGRQSKLISVRKGVFNWGDVKIEGRKNFIEHIKENSLINKLISELKTVAAEKDIILPPEINLYRPEDNGEVDEVGGQVHRDGQEEDSVGGTGKSKKTRRKKSAQLP